MDPLSQEFIKEVLKSQFKDSKTRMGEDATAIMQTVMQTFLEEVALRVARQARRDGSSKVELEHVEKILPQLLLDYI